MVYNAPSLSASSYLAVYATSSIECVLCGASFDQRRALQEQH